MKNSLKIVSFALIALFLALASTASAYTEVKGSRVYDVSAFDGVPRISSTRGLFEKSAPVGAKFLNLGNGNVRTCVFGAGDKVMYDDAGNLYLPSCLNPIIILDQPQAALQADASVAADTGGYGGFGFQDALSLVSVGLDAYDRFSGGGGYPAPAQTNIKIDQSVNINNGFNRYRDSHDRINGGRPPVACNNKPPCPTPPSTPPPKVCPPGFVPVAQTPFPRKDPSGNPKLDIPVGTPTYGSDDQPNGGFVTKDGGQGWGTAKTARAQKASQGVNGRGRKGAEQKVASAKGPTPEGGSNAKTLAKINKGQGGLQNAGDRIRGRRNQGGQELFKLAENSAKTSKAPAQTKPTNKKQARPTSQRKAAPRQAQVSRRSVPRQVQKAPKMQRRNNFSRPARSHVSRPASRRNGGKKH